MAYDVRVLEGCRDLGMRCWSVAPELMRHLGAESEIADVDIGTESQTASSDDRNAGLSGDTANIDCGVRSNDAFAVSDQRKLEDLKDMVERERRCPGE